MVYSTFGKDFFKKKFVSSSLTAIKMKIYKIEKDKKTLNYTEPFLFVTNILTLMLAWKQNTEMFIQKELLGKTVIEFSKVQEKLDKMEILSKTVKVKSINVVDSDVIASEVNVVKWLMIALIVVLSAYSVYVLYMKWIGFSFAALLPKIDIPLDWLPYINQKNFFECILGEFTIRFNISGKKVDKIEAKHLEDLCYKPLEDILSSNSSVCKNLVRDATEALKSTEDVIKVSECVDENSPLFFDPATLESVNEKSPLFFDPATLESVQTSAEMVQTVLNGIG